MLWVQQVGFKTTVNTLLAATLSKNTTEEKMAIRLIWKTHFSELTLATSTVCFLRLLHDKSHPVECF